MYKAEESQIRHHRDSVCKIIDDIADSLLSFSERQHQLNLSVLRNQENAITSQLSIIEGLGDKVRNH